MHYKRKKFNLKNRDFVRCYLFIANKRTMTSPVGKITWTNTVRCGNIICYRQSRGSSDSLDSEEEVPIQADEVFRCLALLSRTITMTPIPLTPTTGSRDSTWKWPIGHQELIWRHTVKT